MNEEANRARTGLTRKQVAERRLRLDGSGTLQDGERSDEESVAESSLSPNRYAASQAKKTNVLRDKFGSDWIFDHPLINPMKIIEEATERPMSAALACYQACVLLNNGHHQRVREYLVAAYSVARGFKAHREQINFLALEVTDGRSSKPVEREIIEKDLLRYVFVFIFLKSGMVRRDRANQYAQSLQYYFDQEEEVSEIDRLLRQFGQDRLRRAAQRRANILQDRREWSQQGKDPTAVTMDEILAEMASEDAKQKLNGSENGPPNHNPPDIAPEDLKFRVEAEDSTDDADWLEENDPNRNIHAPNNDDDSELEHEEGEVEELSQPPEVDEFFNDMMRLTAQMVVGLGDDTLNARYREEMTLLVREVWLKVIQFRGLLA